MRVNTLKRAAVAFALALPGAAIATVVAAPAAHADGCYTWNRTLTRGAPATTSASCRSGSPVGPATGTSCRERRPLRPEDRRRGQAVPAGVRAARRRHRRPADLRQAVPAPGQRLHARALQLQRAGQRLRRGAGGAAARSRRARPSRTRCAPCGSWRRCASGLGDKPLYVSSGFRSRACNNQVGGASDSQHLYGNAADVTSGTSSLCQVARDARNNGFSGIYGPGYPDHDDHVHVDSRRENNSDRSSNTTSWSAPDCGVGS